MILRHAGVRVWLVALLCTGLLVPAAVASAAVSTSDLRLLVRADDDPTVSPLHGSTVDGTIRFVVRPGHKINRVVFKLDGTTIADDRSAPFYAPVDTTTIADGSHTAVTAVTASDGSTHTLRGDFTVKNGSQERTAAPAPDSPSTTSSDDVLLVVGAPGSLNGSERQIRDRLRNQSYDVSIADDDNTQVSAGAYDLIIISKTVTSTKIRDRFKATTTSVMTWEDNAQAIEQGGTVGRLGTGTRMLAWNNAINPTGTAWHGRDQVWRVNPNAPLELRKGMSGRLAVYTSADEMTYAPANTLPASATVVASYGKDTARTTYYVYRAGARLPDGSVSPGRRIYFGLYDDTFKRLNSAGLRLFDGAVDWGTST